MRVRPGPALAQVGGDQRPEMVHPAPDGLVGKPNAAFRQQVFDVAQAQGEPEVEPDRLMDDLRREPVAVVAIFFIPLATSPPEGPLHSERRDNAVAADVERERHAGAPACSGCGHRQ